MSLRALTAAEAIAVVQEVTAVMAEPVARAAHFCCIALVATQSIPQISSLTAKAVAAAKVARAALVDKAAMVEKAAVVPNTAAVATAAPVVLQGKLGKKPIMAVMAHREIMSYGVFLWRLP